MHGLAARLGRRLRAIRRYLHEEWTDWQIERETDDEVDASLERWRVALENNNEYDVVALASLHVRLDALNSRKVERQARRWGVELPDIVFVQETLQGPWRKHPEVRVLYLHPHELDRLRPLIKKAKRETIAWYVQNGIGLIGALTGLIAVIKSKG